MTFGFWWFPISRKLSTKSEKFLRIVSNRLLFKSLDLWWKRKTYTAWEESEIHQKAVRLLRNFFRFERIPQVIDLTGKFGWFRNRRKSCVCTSAGRVVSGFQVFAAGKKGCFLAEKVNCTLQKHTKGDFGEKVFRFWKIFSFSENATAVAAFFPFRRKQLAAVVDAIRSHYTQPTDTLHTDDKHTTQKNPLISI